MLREGVGLMTGLDCNDSEDEELPSPLTRRLSTLTMNSTLTRKASMAMSIRSASSYQFARHPCLRPPRLGVPSLPHLSHSNSGPFRPC